MSTKVGHVLEQLLKTPETAKPRHTACEPGQACAQGRGMMGMELCVPKAAPSPLDEDLVML